jgi:DNA-directed RNA polymerase subunit RPC12/RpoP
MRLSCSQCGAELAVLETDFYLRCPYCEATILVTAPEDAPWLVTTAVGEGHVRKLFPSGTVHSAELLYFPYLETGEGLSPAFSQPYEVLEDYRPPAGDRVVFSDDMVQPEQMIPTDPDKTAECPEGARLVMHPFFMVMLKTAGYSEGVLVDGVSGKALSESPLGGEEAAGRRPSTIFALTLAGALVLSLPVYFLAKSSGADWGGRVMVAFILSFLGAGVTLYLLRRD